MPMRANRWVVAVLLAVPALSFADREQAKQLLLSHGASARVADRAARHIELGMPSAANRQNPNDYLLVRNGYVVSYSRQRNAMNWASWHLKSDDVGTVGREDRFRPDPTLPKDWYRPQNADFKIPGFSRGHMVRSGERTSTLRENLKTTVFTNILPQAINNNSGPWNAFENYYRDAVTKSGHSAYVQAGGIFEGPRVGKGVDVPSATWKIVTLAPGQGGNVTHKSRVMAVIVPNNNEQVNIHDNWDKYRVSVREIERRTGLSFFKDLPHAVAEGLRDQIDREQIASPERPNWFNQKTQAQAAAQ